jgi:hypothetical protein
MAKGGNFILFMVWQAVSKSALQYRKEALSNTETSYHVIMYVLCKKESVSEVTHTPLANVNLFLMQTFLVESWDYNHFKPSIFSCNKLSWLISI